MTKAVQFEPLNSMLPYLLPPWVPLREQHLIRLLISISLENLIWFTPVWVNCVRVNLPQWCLTLCDPVDCSSPGSSVHGILQARILECHSLLQGIFRTQRWKPGLLHCRQIFTIWATREAPKHTHYHVQNRQLMGSCFVTQGAQPGALWQPRGVGWGWVRWRFKTEGTHVYLWLIHIVVWQKPTEHCKEIILWLKINFTKSAESI